MNFSATTEDDTSLKLSWSKPVNTNGEIDYYIVSTFIRVLLIFVMMLNVTNLLHACRFTTVMV